VSGTNPVKVSYSDFFLIGSTFTKYDLSRIETAIIEGHPATTIVEEAHERHVDAVFVGSHGWSGIKSFLMGSVASKVLKNARCSVMIIRPEVKEDGDD
jgi:nucleotide-binding universal stress UspA family protein